MMWPHRAYVALGANLGKAEQTIRDALFALTTLPETQLTATSGLYRTAPVGFSDQPDFINAAAALATALPPQRLLAALLALEADWGRTRLQKNGPRTLDIDLLLFDEQVMTTPELTLPHPRLHLRAFVLAPLAEIATDLRIPGRGSVRAWLPAVALQTIFRLPST